MSEDILGYSSHDWRKNTDDAIVVNNDTIEYHGLDRNAIVADKTERYLNVNNSVVIFKHPKSLKIEHVDVSRLIRVFVNNQESHKRSVK